MRMTSTNTILKKVCSLGLVCAMALSLTGCGVFDTLLGLSNDKPTSFRDVNDLESGKAYVWHHEGGKIEDDLKKASDKDVFFTCITGDYNFKKKELEEVTEYPRSIWIDTATDSKIPTVMAGDYLLYVHDEEIPASIVFERFADYGYTIGISNMQADMGGHYYLMFADVEDDDYKYFIDMESDAAELTKLGVISKLYLDKVGDMRVDKDSVSAGGTVLNLKKDKTYTCEFYTGTYYQDFNLKANIHSFGSFERFVSYDYEFMHSNVIAIKVPDYFVSGYYFVNGVGLFRYVSEGDAKKYNGKAYDENINWNEPMILYNEDGTVLYDPSDPDRYEKDIDEISDPGDYGDVDINVPIVIEEKEDESSGSSG